MSAVATRSVGSKGKSLQIGRIFYELRDTGRKNEAEALNVLCHVAYFFFYSCVVLSTNILPLDKTLTRPNEYEPAKEAFIRGYELTPLGVTLCPNNNNHQP